MEFHHGGKVERDSLVGVFVVFVVLFDWIELRIVRIRMDRFADVPNRKLGCFSPIRMSTNSYRKRRRFTFRTTTKKIAEVIKQN